MTDLRSYLEKQSQPKGHKFYLSEFDQDHNTTCSNSDGPFCMASCSKTILGVILLKLFRADPKVRDKFSNYLTGQKLSLNIFDYIGHTTNLTEYLEIENHGMSVQDVVDKFIYAQKVGKSSFNYCNTNYVVLFHFLTEAYNFDELLAELNTEISEEFTLFETESIESYEGDKKLTLFGNKNKVHGDGGFLFSPSSIDSSKPNLLTYMLKLVKEQPGLFEKNGKKVSEDTIYSFGAFYNQNKKILYHTGFYNHNISYWGIRDDGTGFHFCTNFSSLDKGFLDNYLKIS